METISQEVGDDINTYLGIAINDNLDDDIIVTVIATGFEEEKEDEFEQRANMLKSRSSEDVVFHQRLSKIEEFK